MSVHCERLQGVAQHRESSKGFASLGSMSADYTNSLCAGTKDFDLMAQPSVRRIILRAFVPVEVGLQMGLAEGEGIHAIQGTEID